MIYSLDVSKDLNEEKDRVLERLSSLWKRFPREVVSQIKNPKAREYLLQGSCRRLGTIRRCLWNVFEIFPPTREARLSQDELSDIQINLHASFVNAHGFFDNLAWVCVFERGAVSKLKRTEVGLFLPKMKEYLPKLLQEVVDSKETRNWYSIYAKNFRDALAHRIAPYVPPYQVAPEQQETYNELERKIRESMSRDDFDQAFALQDAQDRIGSISAVMAHSHSDDDASPPVRLHPQMLVDAKTVIMVGNAYADSFPANT